jgi:putative transposase
MSDSLVAVSKTQRRIAALTLPEYEAGVDRRDGAMAQAYFSTAFTMAEIGAHFGVWYKTVSRAVKRYEATVVRS